MIRLFAYGTLQPRAGTPMADWLASRTVRAWPARVPGRLFAVRTGRSWYPALVPAGSGLFVRGTLCELALGPGELARLDRYEAREYRRVCLPVWTDGGRDKAAQVYLWRIPVPPSAPPIAGGDFVGWLRRTRRRAFSTPGTGF